MNRESTITLSIREIGTAAQRTFMFNILLDGKVIVSNQNLSPAESQAVRDFSRRYSILFEQRTRQPRITSDNLKALGTELFKLRLAQSWSKITKNVPVGTLRSLVIASDVARHPEPALGAPPPTRGRFPRLQSKVQYPPFTLVR